MSRKNTYPDSMRDLKRMIRRHRGRFILPFFGVTLAALLISLMLPRRYEATAVFERRNDLVMSEIAGRGAPHAFGRLKRALVEELSGMPAVEAVIDELKLANAAADDPTNRMMYLNRQDLAGTIHRRVNVHYDLTTPQMERVRVVYGDTDPQRAQIVANTLVRNYINRTRQEVDQMLGQAADFFQKQVDIYRGRIDQLEDKKLHFEIENAGMLPQDPAAVQDELADAEARMLHVQQQFQTVERRIERFERELAEVADGGPASIVKIRNPELARVERSMAGYEQQLDKALTIDKMTEKHPAVRGLRRKLAELEVRHKALPLEVVSEKVFGDNPKKTQLEMALVEAQADRDAKSDEVAATGKHVARLRARTAQFFPVQAEYRKFERTVEEAERQLGFWEDNLRRVNVALTAELGQRGISMDFIKPAGAIQRPSSPDLMHVLFAALALGLAAGVVGVLLADRGDQTFRSPEQAGKAVSVPVLGAVGEIISLRLSRWRALQNRVLFPAMVLVMAGTVIGAGYLNYLSLRTPYVFEDRFGPQTPAPMESITAAPVDGADLATAGTTGQ